MCPFSFDLMQLIHFSESPSLSQSLDKWDWWQIFHIGTSRQKPFMMTKAVALRALETIHVFMAKRFFFIIRYLSLFFEFAMCLELDIVSNNYVSVSSSSILYHIVIAYLKICIREPWVLLLQGRYNSIFCLLICSYVYYFDFQWNFELCLLK